MSTPFSFSFIIAERIKKLESKHTISSSALERFNNILMGFVDVMTKSALQFHDNRKGKIITCLDFRSALKLLFYGNLMKRANDYAKINLRLWVSGKLTPLDYFFSADSIYDLVKNKIDSAIIFVDNKACVWLGFLIIYLMDEILVRVIFTMGCSPDVLTDLCLVKIIHSDPVLKCSISRFYTF